MGSSVVQKFRSSDDSVRRLLFCTTNLLSELLNS